MPNQQEVFEAAHAHVAKWEGGYFDHPNDPGGVTMYGVSLMFLKGLDLWEGDIDGDGDIDRDDVLAVTKDTARDIFKRHFWDRPRAGEMPPLVAVCLGVVTGVGGGIIRDVLAREIPMILRTEIYATACIVGGIVHATAHDTFHLPLENSAMMGMVVTLVIRLAAIRWHLKLPTFALDDNGR